MRLDLAGFPYLTAILLSCLVGLLVILFIPAERKALIRWVSAVFSGMAFLLSVYLFIAYDRSQGGLQFVEKVSGLNPWASTISTERMVSICPCCF